MKKLIKTALFLIMTGATQVALSQHTLYVGQLSHHFGDPDDVVREKHPLIIYEQNGWMGGYWRNSYDRDTFSLGYHHILLGDYQYNVGLKAGFVTGYDYPVFGTINFQLGIFDINWVPDEVIGIGFKFNLGE